MAKTKRKQLAALAAIKVSLPVSNGLPMKRNQDEHRPLLNPEICSNGSPSPEVRQQRIIIWIPPLDPIPPPLNSRKTAKAANSAKKRKRSKDKGEGKSSSDTEVGRVYQNYSKIIFKLDKWRLEKSGEGAGPSDEGAPAAPRAQRAYRRMKSSIHASPKKGKLSVLVDTDEPSANPLADKSLIDADSCKLSSSEKDGVHGVPQDHTVAKEPVSEYSKRLSKRKLRMTEKRKAGYLSEWVAANQVPGRQMHEPEEPSTSNTKIFNPTRKVVTASEKEADISPDKIEEKELIVSTRRKSRSVKETLTNQGQRAGPVEAQPQWEGVFESTRQKSKQAKERLMNPEQSATDGIATGHIPQGNEEGRLSESVSDTIALPPQVVAETVDDGVKLPGSSSNLERHKRKVSVADMNTSVSNVIHSCQLNKRKVQKMAETPLDPPQSAMQSQVQSATRESPESETTPILKPRTYTFQRRAVPKSTQDASAAVWKSTARDVQHGETNGQDPQPDQPGGLGGRFNASTSGIDVPLVADSNRAAMSIFQRRRTGVPSEGRGFRHRSGSLNQQQVVPVLKTMARPEECLGTSNSQSCEKLGLSSTTAHEVKGIHGSHNLDRQQGLAKPQSSLNGVSAYSSPPVAGRLTKVPSWGCTQPAGCNHVDLAAKVRSKLAELGGLTEWLVELGLGVFVGLFQERKITEGDLLHLTMGSLKEMGVHAVGPRRKLIWMIEHRL